MRRSRFTLGCLVGVVVALSAGWACIPHPDGDFEDYQQRIASFPKREVEASVFEAAPPPTQGVEGLYYGACMSELAFENEKRVFNFYTLTKYATGEGGSGKLVLSIQALKVEAGGPPANVSKAGLVGAPVEAPAADVAPNGKYLIQLGNVGFPGTANPITGSDVLIENAVLEGRFAEAKFCARLSGYVRQPVPAERQLNPEKNICQFVPIKDGDPTPVFTFAEYQAASCPLE